MNASHLPVSVRGRKFVRQLDNEGERLVIYRGRDGQLALCGAEEWEDWCGARGVSVPLTGSHFSTRKGVEVFVRGSSSEGVRVVMGRERTIGWDRWAQLSRESVPAAVDIEVAHQELQQLDDAEAR